MADFFEVDFLDVETKKSGDAIPCRYCINEAARIHVTDGGFQATGETLVNHINKYYNSPKHIDAVVVTHPDGDHAGGLRALFDSFEIKELWMLRPWIYSGELIESFSRFSSVENLSKRLRELYPNLAALEDLALEHNVPIKNPFQGAKIGEFYVLAPSKSRYLDLIVDSERTPEAVKEDYSLEAAASSYFRKAMNYIKSIWGDEYFPEGDTSAENNMSVIQYAQLCGKSVLLTGDGGRAALTEAADFAPSIGLQLPGIDYFQIPHHGSRHNVSTDVLDRWLGPRHSEKPGSGNFTAVVSSALLDKDHPRKSVIRAFMHRGANVISTEGSSKRIGYNTPLREGWVRSTPEPYPEEQEE